MDIKPNDLIFFTLRPITKWLGTIKDEGYSIKIDLTMGVLNLIFAVSTYTLINIYRLL